MALRPDWESVVAPVVDYALTRTDVDGERIALIGLSLGGYLAPRAASAEHRLAACIADCGPFDIFQMVVDRMPGPLSTHLDDGSKTAEAIAGRLLRGVMRRPTAGWALRRMLLVHGVDDPVELMHDLRRYSLAGHADKITCPTFVCNAEGDNISASAPQLVDALVCRCVG